MASIDLNSDLGESFGPWPMGDDASMLSIVTSANIACGFHAGDPAGILAVLKEATRRGVSVGAHVGYRDLVGFGRRNMDPTSAELVGDTIYQIGALQGLAKAAGTMVSYVKPIVEQARTAGLTVVCEAFADRAYNADGSLVSRRLAGSVIHDPQAVAERMLRLVKEGRITAVDGTDIALDAQTICIHGDTPAAVAIARTLSKTLTGYGVELKAFAEKIAAHG
jgi:5-oxoprolinase (ATP-hydrolysing) subunit A